MFKVVYIRTVRLPRLSTLLLLLRSRSRVLGVLWDSPVTGVAPLTGKARYW
jgi:hypothetical protein